jgi:hypothetical protein
MRLLVSALQMLSLFSVVYTDSDLELMCLKR